MSDLIAFALTLGTQAHCNKPPVDALRLGLRGCITVTDSSQCIHSLAALMPEPQDTGHDIVNPAGLTESNLNWVRVDQLQQVFFYFQEWSFSYPHLRVGHRERKRKKGGMAFEAGRKSVK